MREPWPERLGAEAMALDLAMMNLAGGIIRSLGGVLFGGTFFARRFAEELMWGRDDRVNCGSGCSCGCHAVRHFYNYHCVPPCYGWRG